MLSGTTGTPERLERVDGTWTLEVERLMYRSAWMLHPQRFEVRGEQAILQQLREIRGAEPLAREAERLFTSKSQGELAYVARDGHWSIEIRSHAVTRVVHAEAAAAAALSSEQLDHLNARVDSLEGAIRALQKMVQDLAKATVQAAAAAQRVRAPSSDAIKPPSVAETRVDATEATSPAIEERPAPRAAAPAPAPAAAPAAPAASAQPIGLPTLAAITDLVRGLAGPDAAAMPRTGIDWKTFDRAYASYVLSNDGQRLGLVVFDFECALRLAAALMMESDESVAVMLEQGELSAEMADAAGEVCNTLMSAFNKTAGNPHVKSDKILTVDAELMQRFEAARKREDYSFNRGGVLSLMAL